MPHIGIVAVSPEGSALCYRLIASRAAQRADRERRPTVSLHNLPFASYMDALAENDWERIATMLATSARALASAGADFCVLPDNQFHHAVELAQSHSPIPWLSMIDLVAEAVSRDGRTTVGLIGTRHVVFSSTYQTILGLRGVKVIAPTENDAERIDRIIFSELVHGKASGPSRDAALESILEMKARGAQGVIVGCTELPLLLEGVDAGTPMYDSVALLADAAVERAMSLSATSS